MAMATNITVDDRATPTPLAHTFVRQEVIAGQATFAEPGLVTAGDKRITVRWRTGENGRRYKRVMLTVPVTVVETINGVAVTKVLFTDLVDVTFRFDALSTRQNRKDLAGMFYNIFAPTQTAVDETITGNEGMW